MTVCADCHQFTNTWIQIGHGPRQCPSCHHLNHAPTSLRDRLEAAEATGRAAVRALAKNWKHADSPEDGAMCSSAQCREVVAVLATDTARVWRTEGRDD